MRAVAAVRLGCALWWWVGASPPAFAQTSLQDQLNDIQDDLDMLAAQAARRLADQQLVNGDARIAAGATSCIMRQFCADALDAAPPGTAIECDGYHFTKR